MANLKKVPQVFLTKEKAKVSKDIVVFTREGLSPLRDRFSASVVKSIEQAVVNKADGEYLGHAGHPYLHESRHISMGATSSRYAT